MDAPPSPALPTQTTTSQVEQVSTPVMRSVAPFARDFCYRALRHDEPVNNGLLAKDSKSTISIKEHILNGSGKNFKSPFISTTAELRIAIAFGGPFQGIAAVEWSSWKRDTKGEVIDFANRDNQDLLLKDESDDNAEASKLKAYVSYASRSKEILLRNYVPARYVKQLTSRFALRETTFLKGCSNTSHFPRNDRELSTIQLLELVGGSNDGIFRLAWRNYENLQIKLIYKKARPNVAEQIPDSEHLQRNLYREFLALSFYRRFDHAVPDCCLYEGNVIISDGEGYKRTFPFSFILFEDSQPIPHPAREEQISLLCRGFIVDCLLGNWRLFGFTEEDRFQHIVVLSGGKVARRCAESAFGLVYQDDRQKNRQRRPQALMWNY